MTFVFQKDRIVNVGHTTIQFFLWLMIDIIAYPLAFYVIYAYELGFILYIVMIIAVFFDIEINFAPRVFIHMDKDNINIHLKSILRNQTQKISRKKNPVLLVKKGWLNKKRLFLQDDEHDPKFTIMHIEANVPEITIARPTRFGGYFNSGQYVKEEEIKSISDFLKIPIKEIK